MNIEQAPSRSYVRSGRSPQGGDGAVMSCPRLARLGTGAKSAGGHLRLQRRGSCVLLSSDSSTEARRRGMSRRRGDDKLRFAVPAAAAAANAAFYPRTALCPCHFTVAIESTVP